MTISQLVMTITKKEWRLVLLVAIFVAVITTLPYLYGWYKTPQDKVYTGMHFLVSFDYSVYYSYIEQASDGDLLFRNLYVSDYSKRNMLNTVWILPGIIKRLFNLSTIVSFHLIRMFFIPILLAVGYLFISYFFDEKKIRKLAFFIFTFASGWGFYYLLLKQHLFINLQSEGRYIWPVDIFDIEGNNFLSLYYSPHFIAAIALFLLTFLFLFLAFDNKRISYGLYSGICAFILFSFHPFHFLTIYSIPLFFLILHAIINGKIIWRSIISYLVMVLVSSPIFFYYLWLFYNDTITQDRFFQNYCPSPSLLLVIVGYGALFMFSAVAFIYIISRQGYKNDKYLILLTWLIVQLYMLFLPVSFQSRLTLGLSFPMIILTAFIIYKIYTYIKSRKKDHILLNPAILLFVITLLFLFTQINHFAIDHIFYTEGREVSYILKSEYEAISWLKDNVESYESVLSSEKTGNLIPGFSGRKVYQGHRVETTSFFPKLMQTLWYFLQDHDQEAELVFLKKAKIDFLYYGPYEKELGDLNPDSKLYLRPVYSNSDVTIYEVI